MNDRSPTRRSLLGLLILATVGWFLVVGLEAGGQVEPVVLAALRITASTKARGASAPSAPEPTALEYASDGLPIMPAEPGASVAQGPVHPHPITPAHARIYRENNLVGALNLAVDLEDAPRIRELVARYRAEFPEIGRAHV